MWKQFNNKTPCQSSKNKKLLKKNVNGRCFNVNATSKVQRCDSVQRLLQQFERQCMFRESVCGLTGAHGEAWLALQPIPCKDNGSRAERAHASAGLTVVAHPKDLCTEAAAAWTTHGRGAFTYRRLAERWTTYPLRSPWCSVKDPTRTGALPLCLQLQQIPLLKNRLPASR